MAGYVRSRRTGGDLRNPAFIAAAIAAAFAGSACPAAAEQLDKPVPGPMLVCFKYSIFRLAAGERVTEVSGSPEAISITVDGPRGRIAIAESEIFAPARGAKRLVLSLGHTKVYRLGRDRRYAIYGPTDYSPRKDRLVLLLSGPGLAGQASDRDFYDRFDVRDPAGMACGHIFTYSWEPFLPD